MEINIFILFLQFFKEKNIPKLQEQFIETLKKEITFSKIDLVKKNEHNINLKIPAKE
jgi:hypothetical protein